LRDENYLGLFVAPELMHPLQAQGYLPTEIPIHLRDPATLITPAAMHIAAGKVKVCDIASEKAKTSPFAGALDFRGGDVVIDDPLRVAYQLLDWDEKRMHFFATMHHARDGYLAATSEQMSLHVDMRSRKAAPFPPDVRQRIAALMAAHRDLPTPEQVGHVIGIPPARSKRSATAP
jgi:hypothetical protein